MIHKPEKHCQQLNTEPKRNDSKSLTEKWSHRYMYNWTHNQYSTTSDQKTCKPVTSKRSNNKTYQTHPLYNPNIDQEAPKEESYHEMSLRKAKKTQ